MNENERESIERTDINEEITIEENGDGNGNVNGNREVLTENPMGYKPVRGLLLKMSAPLMISMFVQSLYNIVDSIFVAHLNENALTAVSLAFPIQSLILAFAIGTAVGMSALLSRYLGAKELDKVNLVVHNGIFLAFVTYAIFLVFSFFAEPFIKSQTSDPQIIEYGTQYLTIVCRLSIMVTMQITMERLLQGTGKTKYIFYMQVTGALINVIMDPILIFGLLGAPRLGVAGAAIATVFGQTVGTIMGFYINHTKNHEISMNMKGFRPDGMMIKEIYRIGVPSIIMQAVGSAMTLGMNLILVSFSTTAVATFGAYFKIQSFVFMPIFGMNNGLVPIIAYNYGARKPDRMREGMRISVFYSVAFMSVGTLIFWAVPGVLISMFNPSETMMSLGITALRIISICFPFAGYAIMRGSVFQAVGKSVYSMNISLIRQLGVLLPMAWILGRIGGVTAVWWAFPIAEIAGTGMSVMYTRKVKREIIDNLDTAEL